MGKYEIGQEISVSMLLKITGMDIRPNGSVSYHTNYGMTFPESIIEQTERQKTTPPEAAQNKPTPEPIKLYCVKDFMPGTYATKGKIYEMQKMFVDNRIKFDNGRIERWSSVEGICFDGENVFGKYLVPLVSRPAKMLETIYFPDGYHKGEIHRVKAFYDEAKGFIKLDYTFEYMPEDYLVLDGYQPEPERCKCCGQVIGEA